MVLGLFKQKTFLIKVLPIVLGIIALKTLIFYQHWELFGASALLSGIVTATMFMLGFLLAGVLSDYKESEKLPGELASSLAIMVDESLIIHQNKKDKKAKEMLLKIKDLQSMIKKYLWETAKYSEVMQKIDDLNEFVAHFESVAHASTITRLKQEQNNTRRIMTRLNVIRETSFVSAGYAIGEGIMFFLITGLLFVKVEKLFEAIFFVGIISFVLIYVLNMIKDLDNPFEYSAGGGGDEISLQPLDDFEKSLDQKISSLN